MQRILSLHLDFFVEPPARWAGANARLGNDEFEPWKPDAVRAYLHDRCGLGRNAIPGASVVRTKEDMFHLLREQIGFGTWSAPLEIVHLSARSGLGSLNTGWFQVLGKLLHLPPEKRLDGDLGGLNPETFLLYAAACRWIGGLDFVTHPQWEGTLLPILFRDNDPGSGTIELRRYDHHLLQQAILYDLEPPAPLGVDHEFPLRVIHRGAYREERAFDAVIYCRAPSFTPPSADALNAVVEDLLGIGGSGA